MEHRDSEPDAIELPTYPIEDVTSGVPQLPSGGDKSNRPQMGMR